MEVQVTPKLATVSTDLPLGNACMLGPAGLVSESGKNTPDATRLATYAIASLYSCVSKSLVRFDPSSRQLLGAPKIAGNRRRTLWIPSAPPLTTPAEPPMA